MALSDWDTNPANNTLKPGIDWSEGMLPSAVNNSARQMMADVAAGVFPKTGGTITGDTSVTGKITARTPNAGSTGAFQALANATSGYAYLQFLDALGTTEFAALRAQSGGLGYWNGAFQTAGALTVGGALTSGTTSLGNTSITGTLSLSGTLTASAGLTVSGNAVFNAACTVSAVATVPNLTLIRPGSITWTIGGNGTNQWSVKNDGVGSPIIGIDPSNNFYCTGYITGNLGLVTSGTISAIGAITQNGNQVWHAGNLNPSGMDQITSQSLIENGGYQVHASGYKETWGYVDIAQDSYGTYTLPVAHTSWVNPTIGHSIRAGVTTDSQNTGLAGITGSPPTSISIYNANDATLRVWVRTVGV